MKKSATAYKRANTSKTGIIDPLKLSQYKYNDDIFKKLTILPDAKNHGMIMLLDWSGSMADVIKQTIDQLMNLVWFCQKINIPYEVYLFSSEIHTYNSGDMTI
jgi:ACT domain-containing protein